MLAIPPTRTLVDDRPIALLFRPGKHARLQLTLTRIALLCFALLCLALPSSAPLTRAGKSKKKKTPPIRLSATASTRTRPVQVLQARRYWVYEVPLVETQSRQNVHVFASSAA